jgi:hypothetical protein
MPEGLKACEELRPHNKVCMFTGAQSYANRKGWGETLMPHVWARITALISPVSRNFQETGGQKFPITSFSQHDSIDIATGRGDDCTFPHSGPSAIVLSSLAMGSLRRPA